MVECVHKSVERCHYTYTTQFLPHVQEVPLSLSILHIYSSSNSSAIYQTLPMGSFFEEKVPFQFILIKIDS